MNLIKPSLLPAISTGIRIIAGFVLNKFLVVCRESENKLKNVCKIFKAGLEETLTVHKLVTEDRSTNSKFHLFKNIAANYKGENVAKWRYGTELSSNSIIRG